MIVHNMSGRNIIEKILEFENSKIIIETAPFHSMKCMMTQINQDYYIMVFPSNKKSKSALILMRNESLNFRIEN